MWGSAVKLDLKKIFDRTLIVYLIVGLINTFFGTAVMFGAYNLLHLDYWIATAANYVFGSILSYFLNKHFTFRNRASHKKALVRFTINILACYAVAYGCARPLVRMICSGTSNAIVDNGAMLVGMIFFVSLNYLGQRFFVFRQTAEENGEKGEAFKKRWKK